MAGKLCPFLNKECVGEKCQLWVDETKNCALASRPKYLDDDQAQVGEPLGKKLG